MGIREDLFSILVKKTKELDRQVTASDMLKDKEKDGSKPDPNDYGWYYGKFDDAAKQAYIEGTPWPQAERKVDVMRRIRPCPLSKEKQQTVISEMVDMFIQNDGMMPTNKQIKKNRLISEKDVDDMRWAGLICEPDIRKLAEEKSGRKFLSPTERKRQNIQSIAVEVSSTPKEVKKVEVVNEVTEAVAENVAPIEVKDVAPVEAESIAPVETKSVALVEEPVDTTRKRKPCHRKTDEELWAEIRKKCFELNRIPTDIEIKADEKMSSLATYYNHLGGNFREVLKAELEERNGASKAESQAVSIEKPVFAPEPAPEPKPVPKPAPEPKLAPEPAPEPIKEPAPAPVGKPLARPSEEKRVIPIQVIVPKGIKGTINLTLEF